MYHIDYGVLALALKFIGMGVPISAAISLGALLIGVALGLPIGIGSLSRRAAISGPLMVYVEVFRNIPVLVQIIWIYYVLPIFVGINLDPITAGILALGLNTSAFLSEVFRGGIMGIPPGQHEAGATLGFSPYATMRHIILPQVLRKMLMPLLNQLIILIKESALVAYIGVVDIVHRGDMISTQYARPLEAYTIVAVWYFVLCFGASRLARLVEARVAIPE